MLLVSWTVFGQGYSLELTGSQQDLQQLQKYKLGSKFKDSVTIASQLDELRSSLQKEGYLEVTLTPMWEDNPHVKAEIILGNQYQWVKLSPGNVNPDLLQKAGFKDKFFSGKPFRYHEVESIQGELIKRSNNLGYPFASVKLDSVRIDSGLVSAALAFDSGPLITFDSISITDPVKINRRFLQTYLRIPPGTPFSEESFNQITERIEKLPYLSLTDSPGLTFQNDQATVHLSLKSAKSNQIDGVIGFLPNSKQDGGLLLTGQFNLLLNNMFGSGRRLKFQWEGYKPESQNLNIDFHQPQLLKSPLDLNLRFHLLKEDSSFVNRNFRIDLDYAYSNLHYLGLFSDFKAARLPSSNLYDDLNSFPDLADFNLNQYGGQYRFNNLDNDYNPKSGLLINLLAAAGSKTIKRNSAISDSLYQQLELETSQFSWEASMDKYIRASKHWVLALKWRGGGVYNQRLFFNDLYRLGGLNRIRGFSENTFFADNFAYSTIEPRFFFETNSYLFVFYDQAWWLSYELENNSFSDTPSGFGAGISLTTKAGIFNFAWAVGSSKIQDVGFSQSKIHFGYVSRF